MARGNFIRNDIKMGGGKLEYSVRFTYTKGNHNKTKLIYIKDVSMSPTCCGI